MSNEVQSSRNARTTKSLQMDHDVTIAVLTSHSKQSNPFHLPSHQIQSTASDLAALPSAIHTSITLTNPSIRHSLTIANLQCQVALASSSHLIPHRNGAIPPRHPMNLACFPTLRNRAMNPSAGLILSLSTCELDRGLKNAVLFPLESLGRPIRCASRWWEGSEWRDCWR